MSGLRVAAILTACAAAAMAQEEVPPPGPNEVQTLIGGEAATASELAAMSRAADEAIRSAKAASGSAERRYRRAELEIHLAMRPEFGPANASLFGKRARKLEELRRALGLKGAPAGRVPDLDRFAAAVRDSRLRLEAKGLSVESSAAPAPYGWSPAEPAWALIATDPARKVALRIPYAGTPAGPPEPPSPVRVHPRLTLILAPARELRSTSSLVRRDQPAEPEGALEGAFVFITPSAQSGDQDEGDALRKSCLGALFPKGRTGLRRLAAGEKEPEAEPGGHGVLRASTEGADLTRTLSPR